MPGIPFVLSNDPTYAGCSWSHGYEPEHQPLSFNYEGLIWQSDEIAKPSEQELWTKWDNTYRAIWQQTGVSSPWTALRRKRNTLLSESDWSQLADVSEDVQLAYQTYRQTLRDLPANTTDPENPVWPVKP